MEHKVKTLGQLATDLQKAEQQIKERKKKLHHIKKTAEKSMLLEKDLSPENARTPTNKLTFSRKSTQKPGVSLNPKKAGSRLATPTPTHREDKHSRQVSQSKLHTQDDSSIQNSLIMNELASQFKEFTQLKKKKYKVNQQMLTHRQNMSNLEILERRYFLLTNKDFSTNNQLK
jgi:hypothetical protein